jgi:hypothetical protein
MDAVVTFSIGRDVVATIIKGVIITNGRNVTKKNCLFLPCLLLPFATTTYMLTVGHITLLSRVIKTNVMWPFCIERHIGICPNTLVASIKTNTRKKKIPPKLPPSCMATKQNSVTTRLVIKKFQSLILW